MRKFAAVTVGIIGINELEIFQDEILVITDCHQFT